MKVFTNIHILKKKLSKIKYLQSSKAYNTEYNSIIYATVRPYKDADQGWNT